MNLAVPGTYVLLLRVPRRSEVSVGRLGPRTFAAGTWAYAGNALGPGGLAGRLRHHLASPAAPRWHLDHLRPAARPVGIWLARGPGRRECRWAAALAGLSGTSVPVPRFGATDCRCPAHLVRFARRPRLRDFRAALGETRPGERVVSLRPEAVLARPALTRESGETP